MSDDVFQHITDPVSSFCIFYIKPWFSVTFSFDAPNNVLMLMKLQGGKLSYIERNDLKFAKLFE